MTKESDKPSAISYSSELLYLRLAVKDQEEAHSQICREIEEFKPPSRENLIDLLTIQYSTAPNPASLKDFIEHQADAYLSNPNLLLTIEFANKYAVRRVISILTLHAYCEGLINTILAIALNHFKNPELFRALEMCSLIEKWEICPKAFPPNIACKDHRRFTVI